MLPSIAIATLISFEVAATAKLAQGFKISGFTPAAFSAASPLVEVPNVLSLTSRPSVRSIKYLRSIQTGNVTVDGTYGVSAVISAASGAEYLTPVAFGGTWFDVVVDTGSSDTWLVETGFDCVDVNSTAQPESVCAFGPPYTISSTFSQIDGENFNISYVDGEFLTGIVGYEVVTLANITVSKQQVALVDYTYWIGDGISSGLVGLAYPSLTHAFYGTDPATDTSAVHVANYSPIFTSMITDGSVAPLFTLVLGRGNTTSELAIGGLPPGLPQYAASDFAVAQIQILALVPGLSTATDYSFYTIYPDGFVYNGASNTSFSNGNWSDPFSGPPDGWNGMNGSVDAITTDFPMIVDSGTTFLYVPTGMADAVFALYDPPAYYSAYFEAYVVLCNATAPEFGVAIGGTTFFINPLDMVLDEDLGDGLCFAGIQGGGEGTFILGDTFLKNVVAVFDVGASEMEFAPHEVY